MTIDTNWYSILEGVKVKLLQTMDFKNQWND